jgi:hypothetical protein
LLVVLCIDIDYLCECRNVTVVWQMAKPWIVMYLCPFSLSLTRNIPFSPSNPSQSIEFYPRLFENLTSRIAWSRNRRETDRYRGREGNSKRKIACFFKKKIIFFFAFSHVQMGSAFVVGLSISFRVIALKPTGFG